jgi:hypothetical protein
LSFLSFFHRHDTPLPLSSADNSADATLSPLPARFSMPRQHRYAILYVFRRARQLSMPGFRRFAQFFSPSITATLTLIIAICRYFRLFAADA